MAIIHIQVEPVFHRFASVGTVELIKLIRTHFGLSLLEAKLIVDRCVFAGEVVKLDASADAATAFCESVAELKSPTKFQVNVEL